MIRLLVTAALSALVFGAVTYSPPANAGSRIYDRDSCIRWQGSPNSKWDCGVIDDATAPKASVTSVSAYAAVGNNGSVGVAACVHFLYSSNYTGQCGSTSYAYNVSGVSAARTASISGSNLSLWSTYATNGSAYIYVDGTLQELQGVSTYN